jgi:hypothetical protein
MLLFEGFRLHRTHFDDNLFLLTILCAIVEIKNRDSATVDKVNALLFSDGPVRHDSFSCDNQTLLERGVSKTRNPFDVGHTT